MLWFYLHCFRNYCFLLVFIFLVFGVLYIFLFFKYFKIPQGALKKIFYGIALNACIFFQMGIIVYYFFPYFSPLSLYSLVLTPFLVYIILLLLGRILGVGGILDVPLLWWLERETHTILLQPSFYLFLVCNILSMFALIYRNAFLVLLGVNVAYFSYGLYLYF